jgi:peptidoglycan/LPS O-acetylase OafA/YrhL
MIVPVALGPDISGLFAVSRHSGIAFCVVAYAASLDCGARAPRMQRPYWILNVRPVVWLGKISYSLYLWQQLFAYGERHRPWYFILVAIGLASASYYFVEQPMLRSRERRARVQKPEAAYATAA